jgi:hypothetical protein
MADARRQAFGAVVVFRFDRFARSVSHLARALDEFRALGIEFVLLHEAVDTSTPMGRAMFHPRHRPARCLATMPSKSCQANSSRCGFLTNDARSYLGARGGGSE